MKELSINEAILREYAQINDAKQLKDFTQDLCQYVVAQYNVRLTQIVKQTPKAKVESAPKKEGAKQSVKTAKETATKVVQISISSLSKAQIKKMGLRFEKYSDKCQLLIGETKPIKDEIKSIGKGHWYAKKEGWFLTNKNAEKLAALLKIKTA